MGLFDFFRRTIGAPAAPAAAAGDASRTSANKGPLILIIDDSTTVVILLRRILEQEGYSPIEALNAEDGIKLAIEEQPKLIFLDIVLPGMNGFAAMRNLRRNPRTQGIPVIMMSGNEQATEQFWAEKIGADDFMKKPFSRAEVLTRAERMTRKKPD